MRSNCPLHFLRALSAGSAGRARGIVYRLAGGPAVHRCGPGCADLSRVPPRRERLPAVLRRGVGGAGLAAEFCIPLTENSSRAEMLYRLAEAELRVARQADSQQASARVLESFPLISVRVDPCRPSSVQRPVSPRVNWRELLGRGDLRAFENGARRLRNVFIQPTGGVTRRPGLRHVTPLPGPARLIPFEFNTEQTYLIVLTAGLLRVSGDAEVAVLGGPWGAWMLPQIGFTQNADTLLLTHPEMRPQRVTRSAAGWTITDWPSCMSLCPLCRCLGDADDERHVGQCRRHRQCPGLCRGAHRCAAAHRRQAADHRHGDQRRARWPATVEETLSGTAASADWDESAFSGAHGWPVTCCFPPGSPGHRRVARPAEPAVAVAHRGSVQLRCRNRPGRPGDRVRPGVGPGRCDPPAVLGPASAGLHLGGGVDGHRRIPLTSASIQLNRQTRWARRWTARARPVDVDGVARLHRRSGQGVHRIRLYRCQPGLSGRRPGRPWRGHLVNTPVSMAYDQGTRAMVMADGSLGTLTESIAPNR